MKQSKYSKRRPASGAAYLEKDTNKAIKSGAIVTPRPQHKQDANAHILPNYDVVVFLDDVRNPGEVNLPKSTTRTVARNLFEFMQAINQVLCNKDIKTIFVSFDHYLDAKPNHHHTGMTCLIELLSRAQHYIGVKRIDISGHSSDHSMNTAKATAYAIEGKGLGYYFNMGRG